MSQSLRKHCARRLQAVYGAQRLRNRRPVAGAHGVSLDMDGATCINFSSNDYLGLATDARLRTALADAAERLGCGSAASQMVTGYNAEHAALEAELADWVGRERALIFSSGYAVNLGVISALLTPADHIVADALNHASLIDGCRLSGAAKHVYAHGDVDSAAGCLHACGTGQRLLVTDSVFSMDGDSAPLAALADLAATQDAWLMVDEAHALGVCGPAGAGLAAAAGLDSHRLPVITGALGKAVGVAGGFVAGDDAVIETILQSARSLIFSTAMPPALAAAARCGVAIARAADDRRAHLATLIARFRDALARADLPLVSTGSPIQPVIVGSETAALALSAALYRRGFVVGAIRPPTVAPGTSRLRVTITAAHSIEHIDALSRALVAAWAEVRPACERVS